MQAEAPLIKIIECPRDAMQGLHDFVPTEQKIKYLNQLLKVGFDTLDFGSFVSPKAIPQMRDTTEVLAGLDWQASKSKLLAIVANERGARDACKHEGITYIGFPFSISETFQRRNTNAGIEESLERLKAIKEIADDSNKEVVVYLSMGFGNPYGDPWNALIVNSWVEKLAKKGFKIISLSDTIGAATRDSIAYIFEEVITNFPELEIGGHLHTAVYNWKDKLQAAYDYGCMRFDGAIKGYGGCPMAQDKLIGNMPTENMLFFFDEMQEHVPLNYKAFMQAIKIAEEIFPPDA